MGNQFEIIGYHVDYYVNKKYIGSIKVEEKDREVFGYQGRDHFLIENDLVFKKKKIKKGTLVTTELIPLCGKMLKKC